MDLRPSLSERQYRSKRRSAIVTTSFMMVVAALFVLVFAKQTITGEAGLGLPGALASVGFVVVVFVMQRLILWWYRKLYEMRSGNPDV